MTDHRILEYPNGSGGDRGTEEDKEFVPEGERYDIIYECVHIVRLL